MDLILAGEITYFIAVIIICLRIIYETRSVTKTLAYLIITIFIPVIGLIIYFTFGTNYRKNKLYDKKVIQDENLLARVHKRIHSSYEKLLKTGGDELQHFKRLSQLLLTDSVSPLTDKNEVKVLLNGEEKFPEVLKALAEAKHHIHILYYIFEDDNIGNAIKDMLIRKAREGVEVRFIYDDFGSSSIRKKLVPQLIEAGVKAYPFFRIYFLLLANRFNYRNHRKIIIIDGHTAFTGGINVCDKYINPTNNNVFWRDTHVYIKGAAVWYLQYLFIADFNFCAEEKLEPDNNYFPSPDLKPGNAAVQIAASGPDSETPTILLSILKAIGLASKEILITTPYFIPGESLLDALIATSLSGISIKLLVPAKSDSLFIDSAARSYYQELLDCGVEIYLYKKGFIHSKTMVVDGELSIIGTANMDYRSFELNFEVNAVIYEQETATYMRDVFYKDLKDAIRLDSARWTRRPFYKQLPEKLARLLSPLL